MSNPEEEDERMTKMRSNKGPVGSRDLRLGLAGAGTVLALASAAIFGGAASGASVGVHSARASNQLTIMLFTNLFIPQFKQAWTTPFAKKTGARIIFDYPTDYAKLRLQVEAHNVTDDVVDSDPYEVDPNCGKYWERISGVRMRAVLKQFRPTSKCGVPDYVYGYSISYSKKTFPHRGPKTCKDFFNLKKFPGKRALWSYFFNGAVECAAIAAGANPRHPYPINLNAAYRKLNSIKKNVVIFNSSADVGDLMQNNEVAAVLASGRATAQFIHQGAPFKPSFKWGIRAAGYFSIPKGSPHTNLAKRFFNYILQKRVNRRLSDLIAYGPVTGGRLGPHIPAYYKPFDPIGGTLGRHSMSVNWRWWIRNFKQLVDRWNAYTTS
jgi:putative spermidine/putrescine transport system substrate-binding protein